MMKKFLIIGLISLGGTAFAQDIHFAQLSETPLLINPALTGEYDGFYRAGLNYRNQWPAMGKAFNTMMGSFDMPLERKKKKGSFVGLGAFFYSDKAGDSRFGTTQAKASIASILPTSSGAMFSAGLQVGLVQHSLNMDAIQWPNQYNGHNYDAGLASNETLNKTSFSFLDVAVGMNYYNMKTRSTLTGKEVDKFNIGISFSHASMPIQKFYAGSDEIQYGKVILHTTWRHDIPKTRIGVVPSFVGMLQGPALEIYAGGLIRYKITEGTKMTNFSSESAFSGGLFYRYKDAISPQVYFEFSDYAFGLSYDFNISSYGEVQKSAGGFEISLRYSSMRGALMKPKI